MKKTTLKDIANKLDLSISTISKALNDNHEISLERRTQIKRLASSLDYRPNNLAVSLKSKITHNIGLVIPNLTEYFFAMLFEGIEEMAAKKGYKVITCVSNDSGRKESKGLQGFGFGNVDGVLISLASGTQKTKNYDSLKKLIDLEIPIVMFDRTCNDICCDKVILDDEKSGYNATKHLIQTGRKKIMFLSTIANTNVSRLRSLGYTTAVKEAGLDEKIILNINYKNFHEQLIGTMKSKCIDGIVAAGEKPAIYAMNILQNNGYQVPDDVSVIGFTNGNLSKYSYPSLTTMNQHASRIGRESVDLLIARIEKLYVGKPICTVIESTLIQRQSTSISKKSDFVYR